MHIRLRLFISIFLLLLIGHGVFSQEQERTRLRMYFYKEASDAKRINLILTAGRGKNMAPVSGVPITLSALRADTVLYIATLNTNEEGILDLYIESAYQLPVDKDGFATLTAEFQGNEKYGASSAEILVRDVHLDILCTEEDSVKMVTIQVYEILPDSLKVPAEGIKVEVGVQRLYSLLPLADFGTDVDGSGTLEFPPDIPGDSLGMISITARIVEHEYYGTVQQDKSIQWGVPVTHEMKPLPRQLWTDEAPIWMMIAVFVVLGGAWFHFFLSVYLIGKIKKFGNDSVSS